MKSLLRYCEHCKEYTMKQVCKCGNKTIQAAPPRFSPEDKYGKYRRMLKKEMKRIG